MIEYKNVALRYTEKDVLRDVNLRIEDGEFMVLVGPSGSGKTTMIKMINRLLEPTDGNIYMDDKRIKDYDERELRLSTGYVLQAIALFPNLTVAENIALIPEMKGWSKADIQQKTDELLELVGFLQKTMLSVCQASCLAVSSNGWALSVPLSPNPKSC